MDTLPPLHVRVDRRGCSCILDVRLALAPLGPMLALRLAEELPVCLVPTLWDVLDNTAWFDSDPQVLFSDPLMPEGYPAGFFGRPALDQWERARTDLGLSALGIYWAGDALHHSSLPREVDPGVVRRFDAFGQGLELRLHNVRPELRTAPPYPLVEGSVGAVALAAAMTRYRPLILSVALPGSSDTPPLCRLLTDCGIPCRRLEAGQSRESRRALAPLLVRTGAMDLIWAGLPVIAIHLVVPCGLTVGSVDSDPEIEGEDPLNRTAEDAGDGWQDATAFWYSLP